MQDWIILCLAPVELEGLIQDNETFREVGIKNGSGGYGASCGKQGGEHGRKEMENGSGYAAFNCKKVETSAVDVEKRTGNGSRLPLKDLAATWSSGGKGPFLQNYQKGPGCSGRNGWDQYAEVAEGLGFGSQMNLGLQAEEEISGQIQAYMKG